jgi:Domain of unknown function (DUF4942)/Methyltransferase small domain
MFETALQFFPSTDEVASEVFREAGIKLKMSVCDPTAGNGVLLDKVLANFEYGYHGHKPKTYAIEIDQELRYILQGKGHKVIGTDFLEYAAPMKFDRIIMNPPFAKGAEMTLKAWSHLKDGGRLVSILNAETLGNAFSGDRKALAALVLQYGHQKELGRAFLKAVRRANAEVVLIVLNKPEKTKTWDFSDSFTHDQVEAEEFKANPLAHTNVIKNLVAKYKACELTLIERHETQSKLNFYLSGVSQRVYEPNRDRDQDLELNLTRELTDEIMELKSRFWSTVFDKTELGKKATSSFREKFTEFSQQQQTMEFSEPNIIEMLSMFFLNREQIMNDCIIDAFDKATGFHEKNCIHREGWKTNKSYKLNKRIIHPDGVVWCKIFHNLSVGWHRQSFLDDLDKVLCWLSGQSTEDLDFVGTYKAIDTFCRSKRDYQQLFESTFFKIRVYKKGTMHLDFKDLYLLDDFNLAAAKGKKWLGADY